MDYDNLRKVGATTIFWESTQQMIMEIQTAKDSMKYEKDIYVTWIWIWWNTYKVKYMSNLGKGLSKTFGDENPRLQLIKLVKRERNEKVESKAHNLK